MAAVVTADAGRRGLAKAAAMKKWRRSAMMASASLWIAVVDAGPGEKVGSVVLYDNLIS